jgi:hypothetical protein
MKTCDGVEGKRIYQIMRKLMLFVFSLVVSLVAINSAFAGTFKVIRTEFFWHSSNLTEIQVSENQNIAMSVDSEQFPLGYLAHDRYFEQHGTSPPLNFIQPLKRGSNSAARLNEKQIIFSKYGLKRSLKTNITPSGADPAAPYLLGIPASNLVLIVYPYYYYGCKENDHIVEVYSEFGTLLHTFDSLPTHGLNTNPNILISPEKSGCCDSLRWSIRIYNLDTGVVSNFSCPEGFCGDVLFTKLGNDGPFIVGQEITGSVQGVGATLQTNIFVIDTDGSLLASGKTIHVVRNPSIRKRHLRDISPYSISKLVSLKPADDNMTWFMLFYDGNRQIALKLAGISYGLTPAVAFLIAKNPDDRETVELDDQQLGTLPILGISEPGEFTFSRKNSKSILRMHIQADKINKLIF